MHKAFVHVTSVQAFLAGTDMRQTSFSSVIKAEWWVGRHDLCMLQGAAPS